MIAALLVVLLAAPAPAEIRLAPALAGRSFTDAVFALQRPGDAARWYVVERAGRIQRVPAAGGEPTVVADLTDRVAARWGYAGLLGVAFHPDGQRIVLSFTERVKGVLWSRIEQFPVRADGTIDTAAPTRLLSLEQPSAQHNNGHVAFGPDGMLYVGFGDGQLGGDPPNNAQNRGSLFGKILRVDVRGDRAVVPPDNPFVEVEGARGEVWAYGLRNPWRFSFDRATGDLWAGDVGQATREEVDLIVRGGNYGWPAREGTECFRRSKCHKVKDVVPPITEYDHSVGYSITGGYVYRGPDAPALVGQYIFGDFGSGRIWAVRREGEGWVRRQLLDTRAQIASFAEGLDGALYVVSYRRDKPTLLRVLPVVDAAH